MDLKERIDALVNKADELSADYYKRSNFTFAPPPKHRADYTSDKWARIVVMEERNGVVQVTSVYCFVCLKDGFTKALGAVKAGDIHKAATFKAPAKHARGSVFQDNLGNSLTEHGAVYLKS